MSNAADTQTNNERPKPVDCVEGAGRIGVSVVTLRRLVRQGEIPYYRVGRRIVFRPDELDQYLDQRRVAPAGAA